MALDDFITDIRGWLNRSDYSDELITSFIRIAESDISKVLRVSDQLAETTVSIVAGKGTLPSDLVEPFLILKASGYPLSYMEPNAYHRHLTNDGLKRKVKNRYYWSGTTLYAGGDSLNGSDLSVTYYGQVPAFTSADTWLYTKYYSLYLAMAVSAGYVYAHAEDMAEKYAQTAYGKIEQANGVHTIARHAGSRLSVTPNVLR